MEALWIINASGKCTTDRLVLPENKYIQSESEVVETAVKRIMVKDTDNGKKILKDYKCFLIIIVEMKSFDLTF